MVKRTLRRDPFAGTVIVFRAKRADRLKLIFWDGTGLVMIYKRLEKQGFAWLAVIEGGLPTEGALAHVLVSKNADHCPLYRLC